MHFKRTAHLGALHVEGGQLPAVGLLLERRPEVKVHGSHSQVDSTLHCEKENIAKALCFLHFHATCHNVLLKFSGKSDFKRQSFKEVTRSTDNWCEKLFRWPISISLASVSQFLNFNFSATSTSIFQFLWHIDLNFPHTYKKRVMWR